MTERVADHLLLTLDWRNSSVELTTMVLRADYSSLNKTLSLLIHAFFCRIIV